MKIMMAQRINSTVSLVVPSAPMNFVKGNGKSHETNKKEKIPTSAEIEPTTVGSGFDRPLPYRLSYEANREQVVGDVGGNCGNVNVKDTNECYSYLAR